MPKSIPHASQVYRVTLSRLAQDNQWPTRRGTRRPSPDGDACRAVILAARDKRLARQERRRLRGAGVHGRLFSIGDADQEFAIESVSKLFVFALVCHTLGHEEARRKLGVNSTGLPFNSVMAIELNADRTMNPLVNAGAMATTSLVPGTTAEEKFDFVACGPSVTHTPHPILMPSAS